MSEIVVRPAKPGDLEPVLRLLQNAELPLEGVEQHFTHFLVADEGESLVGSVGLECYEDVGILRSLAVTSVTRGGGLGSRLVEELFALARREGLRELYLLTTTADRYFPRFGFEIISREQADPRLLASREFQDACPESAICMRRAL